MFNWFAKKVAKAVVETQQEAETKKDLQKWHYAGGEAVREFSAAVDEYLAPLAQFRKEALDRFRGSLDAAETSADIPPLRAAGYAHQHLVRDLNRLKSVWVGQVCDAHPKWMELFAKMEVTDDLRRLVESKVEDVITGMVDESFRELLSRVDHLTPIDVAWRAANPEKSAQFPAADSASDPR